VNLFPRDYSYLNASRGVDHGFSVSRYGPYLEGELWQAFHRTLAQAIRSQLQPQLTAYLFFEWGELARGYFGVGGSFAGAVAG